MRSLAGAWSAMLPAAAQLLYAARCEALDAAPAELLAALAELAVALAGLAAGLTDSAVAQMCLAAAVDAAGGSQVH